MDLTKKEDVVELMLSSETISEWNENCDKVKAANNGYPKFWYSEIVLAGLYNRVMEKIWK